MTLSPKIEPRHQRLQAIVYIRQSTPKQVQNNQESTRRQYQLAERARQMGWAASQIRVIDEDLGLSGASSRQRTGFQSLVAAIGLGEVGIILVTEVSRLSRCNSDWHRVIELCGVFRTLIADEDGVYDARDPNDLLLLGVKGTLFAAELHILRGRMRGNLLNKARRGELALRLPVGFRRRPDGVVVQDPDDAVRLAISTVFERFAVLRSARAVQRHFLENRLTLPRCAQTGATAGSITWVRPTYQMIQQILTNPAYAGVFVYGRRRREAVPGDPPEMVDRRVALTEWDIVVPDVYPGYLSYDAYLANRQVLKDNLYNFAKKGRGAPREGLALLTGLVVCGRCGRRMAVNYGSVRITAIIAVVPRSIMGNRCVSPARWGRWTPSSAPPFWKRWNRSGWKPPWPPWKRWNVSRQAISRHWQLRLERARYEVAMAQRQYDAVDPDNRLVARELERRWNTALGALETLDSEYALMRRTDLMPLERCRAGGGPPDRCRSARSVARGNNHACRPQKTAASGGGRRDRDGRPHDAPGRCGHPMDRRRHLHAYGVPAADWHPCHHGRRGDRPHPGAVQGVARPCDRPSAQRAGPAHANRKGLDLRAGPFHAQAARHPDRLSDPDRLPGAPGGWAPLRQGGGNATGRYAVAGASLGAAWDHQVRSALSLFQAVGPVDGRGHHEARWLSRRKGIADCH